MKKIILKDDNGKSLEVDLKEFLDHLNEYYKFTHSRWMRIYS